MLTRFQQIINPPYSLHDACIHQILCQNDRVCLQCRYECAAEPYPQGNGSVTLEKVDLDSSCVLLLSPFGRYGTFQGKKLTLSEFLHRYDAYSFEITDELYGYHQVEYIGYLSFPNKDDHIQMSLSFCFDGDSVYETEEPCERNLK